jgi:hypothetical protein
MKIGNDASSIYLQKQTKTQPGYPTLKAALQPKIPPVNFKFAIKHPPSLGVRQSQT